MPYTSSDYFQQDFQLSGLKIEQRTIYQSNKRQQNHYGEFIVILSDNLSVEINGVIQTLRTGDLLQIMPYHIHRFLLSNQTSGNVLRIIVPFHLILQLSTNKQLYTKAVKNLDQYWPIVRLSHNETSYMMRMLHFFEEESSLLPDESDPLIFSVISTLSYLFQKNLRKNDFPFSEEGTLSWRCIQYIHFHHQDPKLTNAMVANQIGISTQELDHALKKIKHTTFKKILTEVRLQNAIALLSYADLSIAQIATICGFKNEASLYSLFHLYLKQTPTEVRTSYQSLPLLVTDETNAYNLFSFLVEHCQLPLTTDSFCQTYHVSKKQLQGILKKTFQLSFAQLLQQARIQRAYILATYTDDTLDQITKKIGASSLKTTYRYLKIAQDIIEKSKN